MRSTRICVGHPYNNNPQPPKKIANNENGKTSVPNRPTWTPKVCKIIDVYRIWATTFTYFSGLLSNQREKSINLYFIMVPLRKKY